MAWLPRRKYILPRFFLFAFEVQRSFRGSPACRLKELWSGRVVWPWSVYFVRSFPAVSPEIRLVLSARDSLTSKTCLAL